MALYSLRARALLVPNDLTMSLISGEMDEQERLR